MRTQCGFQSPIPFLSRAVSWMFGVRRQAGYQSVSAITDPLSVHRVYRARTGRGTAAVTLVGLLLRTGWKSLDRLKRKAVCRVIGHDIDPCDCYASKCYRCGLVFDWCDPPRDDLPFMLMFLSFKRFFRDLMSGRVFLRDKNDYIPF